MSPLETANDIFSLDQGAFEIAKHVIAECVAVASLEGIIMEPEKILDSLLLISRPSSRQLISTYQELLNDRPTEIDALNFAFVRIAAAKKCDGLVKETGLLDELVKIKSIVHQGN